MLCVLEPFVCFVAGMMCCLSGLLIKDEIDENAHNNRPVGNAELSRPYPTIASPPRHLIRHLLPSQQRAKQTRTQQVLLP